MAWKIVKVFFRQVYDDLFSLMVANLIWLLLSLPLVTMPAASLSLFEYVYVLLRKEEEPDYHILWSGVRKWFWRGLAVYGLILASVVLPLVGVFFYASLSAKIGMAGFLLSALCFWTLVFSLMAQIYFVPFLIHQKLSVGKALKRAVQLTLLRPGATLVALGVMVLLWIALAVPPFIFILFLYASAAALLKMAALLIGLEQNEDGVSHPALRRRGRGEVKNRVILLLLPPLTPPSKGGGLGASPAFGGGGLPAGAGLV